MATEKVTIRKWEPEERPIDTVPIYMNVEIARVDPHVPGAAKAALAEIGSHWDVSPFEGSAFHGSYSFELDEHRFEVSVTPVPKP